MLRRTILFFLFLAGTYQLPAQNQPGKFRISGKTVNAVTGQVLAGAEVSIIKAEQLDSVLQKMLTTDDGSFSFAGLEPGKYLLVGRRNGFSRQSYEQHGIFTSAVVVGPGLISENLVFRLRPDGRIVGRVVDENQEPVPNAMVYLFRSDPGGGFKQVFQRAQVSTDDRGYYRLAHIESGRYYVLVSAQPWFAPFAQANGNGNQSAADKTTFDVVFPITFYPGVTDAGSATPIVLDEGQEFTADFALSPVPALRLLLNHLNSSPEQPRNASLAARVFGTEIFLPGQRVTPVDGNSNEIAGVAPGKYVLDIESYGAVREKRSTVVNVFADAEFDVEAASPAPSIRGVVQKDGGLNLTPQAFVLLWNPRRNEALQATIDDKGQFEFTPDLLAPGDYSVFVASGLNSTISSLSATGAQVEGQTIRVATSKPIELRIGLSGSLSTINGIARRNNEPFAGVMILLVPQTPEKNLPLFRRDQSDSDGTFTLHDVLPGRYKILAIEDGWDVEWADMSLFKARLERAPVIDVAPDRTYQTTVNVE
ncbi:MAG: carboxypeptidase-like regulatory domain-containing protein [Candidatus Sulfotelmatobacter sp.]